MIQQSAGEGQAPSKSEGDEQLQSPSQQRPDQQRSGRFVLRAVDLEKSYSNKPIVRGVSFEVHSGEVVGLLGPNGAGKTTSFYMVVGLVQPTQGRVLLNGEDITEWPMHQRARAGITYLPQESSVFRQMTVEENVWCVLEMLPLSHRERQRRLSQLLDELSLNPVARQKAFTLSGGERRRVEVARALALNPAFLLLDEPFAGIDPLAVSEIQRMIQLLKTRGIGILITDHNVRETLEICDLGYLLSDGRILEKGSPQAFLASPTARKAYLGEKFQV
jgi:lipopolysaccharide export system ATP-binding protein